MRKTVKSPYVKAYRDIWLEWNSIKYGTDYSLGIIKPQWYLNWTCSHFTRCYISEDEVKQKLQWFYNRMRPHISGDPYPLISITWRLKEKEMFSGVSLYWQPQANIYYLTDNFKPTKDIPIILELIIKEANEDIYKAIIEEAHKKDY